MNGNVFECPACQNTNNTITRGYYDGHAFRRTRVCKHCGMAWNTMEVIEKPKTDRKEFNKERNKERRAKWKELGLCTRCGKPNDSESGLLCRKCCEYRARYQKERALKGVMLAHDIVYEGDTR